MDEVDMSSAASAEAARREKRRKRILENSKHRMKLILGQAESADPAVSSEISPQEVSYM